MFGLFKRKKICVHDWHLVDSFTAGIGVCVEEDKFFVVACPKCDLAKNIIEHEYPDFEKTFKVKAPS